MKLLIIAAVFAVIVFIMAKFFTAQVRRKSPGQVSSNKEFARYFRALQKVSHKDAYLIIKINNTEDFIGFGYLEPEGFIIDFPFENDRQKNLLPVIKEACKSLDLNIQQSTGPDGQPLFDVCTRENYATLATKVTQLFQKIYNMNGTTPFEFSWQNLDIQDKTLSIAK